MMKNWIVYLSVLLGLVSGRAYGLGECGMACCIGGAMGSGVSLASNFGASLQYEYSFMKTLRQGRSEVTPDQVINQNWSSGETYKVPTEMIMKKWSLTLAKPISERIQTLFVIPYVINDMDMRMKSGMGMTMDMTMDRVEGLGDISALGLYTLYSDAPIRPTHRLTVGGGLKLPTGKNDVMSNGNYVHAMMQPGTGSLDPLFVVNYMRAFYPLVLQTNLFYHWSTKGDEGYEFGDQLAIDLIARYQVHPFINVGLNLNGIWAGQDTDHDGNYSKASSMVDNPQNTGLTSVFLTPNLQYKIPNTAGSLDLKYQTPIYQNVNGTQQVVDSRWLLSTSWAF